MAVAVAVAVVGRGRGALCVGRAGSAAGARAIVLARRARLRAGGVKVSSFPPSLRHLGGSAGAGGAGGGGGGGAVPLVALVVSPGSLGETLQVEAHTSGPCMHERERQGRRWRDGDGGSFLLRAVGDSQHH